MLTYSDVVLSNLTG